MTSFTPQEIESLQGQGNEVRAALRLLPFLSLYKFDKFYMSELSLNFFPNETLDKYGQHLRSFQRLQLSFNIILMQVPLWEHDVTPPAYFWLHFTFNLTNICRSICGKNVN